MTNKSSSFITSYPEAIKTLKGCPFLPVFLAANPVRNANTKRASIFLLEKSSVNSPTVKKLTILLPHVSSFAASEMISELPDTPETGKRYTAQIVKTAAVRIKNKKVRDITRMIFPNLDCCSKEEIELDTAKNTKGTTLTKRRLRKISPRGFIYSTKPGATIPMMLPIVIPKSKNMIPE
jgi:hypothetical protein